MPCCDCKSLKILDGAFHKWYNTDDYCLTRNPQQKFILFTYKPDWGRVDFHVGYFENELLSFFDGYDKKEVMEQIQLAHKQNEGKLQALAILCVKYENMIGCRYLGKRCLVKE